LIDIMSFIGIECFGILEFSVNDYVDFLADRIGLPVRCDFQLQSMGNLFQDRKPLQNVRDVAFGFGGKKDDVPDQFLCP